MLSNDVLNRKREVAFVAEYIFDQKSQLHHSSPLLPRPRVRSTITRDIRISLGLGQGLGILLVL